ncbi:hypothetical protein [Streptococcus sp. 20-1249]|uniref:hypothetical protein n=1 Tax=Streptococcus hepaticus TaxID=3349163 RepID=UPI0037492B77
MKNKKQSLKLIFVSFAAAATVAVVPLSQTAVFANENAAQKTTIETIDCSNLPAPDLSDYKTLTDAERTKLIEADKKAQDITAQMDKLLGEDGKVTDQAKLDQLQTKLDDLYKSVESIPAKVDAGNASKA